MAQYVLVSQTVSKSWLVPEGTDPRERLVEILAFGFDDEPTHEEVLGEEYFLVNEDGTTSELTSLDDNDEETEG